MEDSPQIQTATVDDIAALLDGAVVADQQVTTAAGVPDQWVGQERYEVGEFLGCGAAGVVHESLHCYLQRHVALKFCSVTDPKRRARFQREAQITAELEHPAIVPVYDAGDGFLAMKRITGRSLEAYMLAQREPDLPYLVDALSTVCSGLAFAHTHGIVHRDLKASNVMLGNFSEVQLVDWGLACQLVDDHLPESDEFGDPVPCAGTPACLAPEVAAADRLRIGRPADVFGLGALLYTILTGSMPFFACSVADSIAKAREGDYKSVFERNAKAPPVLVELQTAMMQRNPDDRPTLVEVHRRLKAWLLQAGNHSEARRHWELGKSCWVRAQSFGRKQQEEKYDSYLQALAEYEKAMTLDADQPGLIEERERLRQMFVREAIKGGDIALARILTRTTSLPVG